MIPVIDIKKCNKCGMCIKTCLRKAINIDLTEIDDKKCFTCLQCMAVCPQEAVSFNNKIGADIDYTKIDSIFFENLIYKRRSIRVFNDKLVPEDIINKMVELLRYAPTGTNSQKVYITIVSTKEKLNDLSDRMIKFFNIMTKMLFNFFFYPFWFLIAGKSLANKLYGFKKSINRYFEGDNILTYNAPCLFIFHAPKNSSTPAQDCSIWSTIGSLYAESLGLGTCFNGFMVMGLNLNKKIKKSLDIPKGHKVHSTFLLGYPDVKYLRNVIREETKVNIIR